MSVEESWRTTLPEEESSRKSQPLYDKSGHNPVTGIYHSLDQLSDNYKIPTRHDLDTVTYLLSHFPSPAEAERRIALIDSATNQQVSYSELHRSIRALASALYHAIGLRKGEVVFLLSQNSILYPTICLAILSIGAIISPTNPINTELEISKQILDSGAKLAISAPDVLHKLRPNGIPTIVTTRLESDQNIISIEELIECGDDQIPIPKLNLTRSDTAAILYSSGTTGVSKGVILTHDNFISILTLLRWSIAGTNSDKDTFLCFIPMYHIYGIAFFVLGLFSSGITTVVMQKYDFQAMIDAIQKYQINNVPAVPPVILGFVKHFNKKENSNYDLSSLRRIGSGAAPLSKEVTDKFRERFPWVELRQGYGLTESCGATSFFVSGEEAKTRSGSCGKLLPSFYAKVVDTETGMPLPPGREGELWIRGPAIMKGYLGNDEATAATMEKDGWWLKTGDLCYFDKDGFLYIVDRIKELIKHNGYQVAPAELEAILLSHSQILDAAVVPHEDEEVGQIPVAYIVRAVGSELTEDQIIQFVANQVAPYKKVRKVSFIKEIPKSTAGKILRKQLIVLQAQQQNLSKL
ncbi:hypothetical protein ACFE04_003270 [Oxalis oulophora]